MKKRNLILSMGLVLGLASLTLFGCSSDEGAENTDENTEDKPFSYSDGLDENGYWEGITATDYVEMFDYDNLEIPADVHEISDESVQAEVDAILSSYSTDLEITDRAVEDGDTLNIDYVGTVDGAEFSGGNTNGAGTEVTIGVTNYIDDFLEQLIGHNPGETFSIEVTFPEDYGNEEVNGKDAIFEVTINHIVETEEAELNDAFVAENLTANYGWTTVDGMREGIYKDLQQEAISGYVQDYFANDVTVSSVPDSMMEYQEKALVSYYEQYAESYGVEFDEFLTAYLQVETVEELIENSKEDNTLSSHYYLVIQAIAEDTDTIMSDEDIKAFFYEYYGSDDFSSYEEQYGKPYLKLIVMGQNILDRVVENAVLA